MKLSYIYKSEKDREGVGFVQVQFDSLTKEEIIQIKNLFGEKKMTGIWLCMGQISNEDTMLDCIQVYCDQWGSNCDTTFSDYKEDFIKELQTFMTKVMTTENADSLIGTPIALQVA